GRREGCPVFQDCKDGYVRRQSCRLFPLPLSQNQRLTCMLEQPGISTLASSLRSEFRFPFLFPFTAVGCLVSSFYKVYYEYILLSFQFLPFTFATRLIPTCKVLELGLWFTQVVAFLFSSSPIKYLQPPLIMTTALHTVIRTVCI